LGKCVWKLDKYGEEVERRGRMERLEHDERL
jgi:hypothetical protein